MAKKQETSSVIDKDRLKNFKVHEERTPGGRKSFDNDDEIAALLRGKDMDALETIAEKKGVGDRFKDWKRRKLNPGMIRMNLGNVLRALARAKGEGKPARAKKARSKKAA